MHNFTQTASHSARGLQTTLLLTGCHSQQSQKWQTRPLAAVLTASNTAGMGWDGLCVGLRASLKSLMGLALRRATLMALS